MESGSDCGAQAGGHAGNNAAKDQNGRYQPYPTTKPALQGASAAAPVETASTPAVADAEENTPSAPAIHPSRTALLNGPDPALKPRPARSAFPSLHPGANYPPPRAYGRGRQQHQGQGGTKNYATGMNGFTAGDAPMRSWGGSPVPEGDAEAQPAGVVNDLSLSVGVAAPVVDDGEKKKKKKKKGDKGGTGSRANSNTAKRETAEVESSTKSATPVSATTTDADADAVKATAEAPTVVIPATPMATDAQHTRVSSDGGDSKKKRKADAVDASSASSSKTAKKLRKALHALAAAEKASVPLATLIEKISEQVSKKSRDAGVIDATGVARDIKVKFVQGSEGQEGSWVLEV